MAQAQAGMNRFYLLLGGIAAAGAALLLYMVNKPKAVSIPADVSILAADTAGFQGYFLGSDSAKVTVSEYADYQCPACRDFDMVQFPTVRQQLIETGLVRWRYRDFPLSMHPHSREAAHAAACAGDQGKLWDLHAIIYQRQPDWAEKKDAMGEFRDYAAGAGVNLAKYDECMQSARYAGRIQAGVAEGLKLGVNSTPSFLIGGRLYAGSLPSDSIKALVQAQLGKPAP
jgi:protein-disulfide isomerase